MSQAGKYYDGSALNDIETITGNAGGAVGPDGVLYNVTLTGLANSGIYVTGIPGTNTLNVAMYSPFYGVFEYSQAGAVTTTTDILTMTNRGNNVAMTNTGTGLLFNQWYFDGVTPALADAGRLAVLTEGNWTSVAATQNSAMQFSTCLAGTVAEKARITSAGYMGIGTTAPSSFLDIEKAGVVSIVTNFLELTNTVNANPMIYTGTAIKWNQWYFDAVTPAVADCAAIIANLEGNWTSVATTRNSQMSFRTCLSGTVTERVGISSAGTVVVTVDGTGGGIKHGVDVVNSTTNAQSRMFRGYAANIAVGDGIIGLDWGKSATNRNSCLLNFYTNGVAGEEHFAFNLYGIGDLIRGYGKGWTGFGIDITPTSPLDVQVAGTAKSTVDFLEITNSVSAADMDGTGTGILFNQFAFAGTPAVRACGRIAMVTEQDWTIADVNTQDSYMTLQTALNGTVAEKVHIDSAGSVTEPLQPSFLAYQSATVANVTGNGATHTLGTTALTEVFDRQANFNVNGTFTAPVTGIYFLHANVSITGCTIATTFVINIVTTARTYTNTYTRAAGATDQTLSITALADMAATNTATVTIQITGEAADTDDVLGGASCLTYFCGHLVC